MNHKRLISAAAGSLLAVSVIAGCSEAEDMANEAKDQAESAASEGLESGKDAAESGAEDATGAAEGDDAEGGGDAAAEGEGGLSLDLGDFADDPNAKVVGSFYEARQKTVESGGQDTADLKKVTSPALFQRSSKTAANADASKPFTANATGVEGSTVQMCVGPEGALRARDLTVEGDVVAANDKGSHQC